jgi:hypothetical protein
LHEGYAFACPVLELGSLRATSTETAYPHTAEDLWAALGGRVGADLPLSSQWSVRGFAEILGTIRRPTLTIDGQPAYEYPVASGGVGAALVFRFL